VQILSGMRHRPDTRFKLDLGDQLSTLLTKVGVCPTLMRDIRADPTLLEIWREMSRDLMPLMCHIVGAVRILAVRRDPNDRHKSSSNKTRFYSTPSNDEGGRDHPSPHPPPPSPHPDHEEASHIPPPPLSPHLDEHVRPIPHPPLSPHLDEHVKPIPHPPLSPHLDEHVRPIPHSPLSPHLDEQARPIHHPSFSTTDQFSTTAVNMQIIPSAGPYML
jgi:hypothetical protein